MDPNNDNSMSTNNNDDSNEGVHPLTKVRFDSLFTVFYESVCFTAFVFVYQLYQFIDDMEILILILIFISTSILNTIIIFIVIILFLFILK